MAGRIFNMPHASKAGIVGIFVVVLAAIAFVVAPGIVDSILGNGCIWRGRMMLFSRVDAAVPPSRRPSRGDASGCW